MISRSLTVTFTCDRCGAAVTGESDLLPQGWVNATVSTPLGTRTYQIGPECLEGLNGRSPLLGWWKDWTGGGGNPDWPPSLTAVP